MFLFLPENEIHELGLMYLNYELVLRGNSTIYLGQSLPLSNLDYFFESDTKICFITSLTVQPYDDKILSYFQEINDIIKGTDHKLIAVGSKTLKVKEIDFEANVSLYPSVVSLLKTL